MKYANSGAQQPETSPLEQSKKDERPSPDDDDATMAQPECEPAAEESGLGADVEDSSDPEQAPFFVRMTDAAAGALRCCLCLLVLPYIALLIFTLYVLCTSAEVVLGDCEGWQIWVWLMIATALSILEPIVINLYGQALVFSAMIGLMIGVLIGALLEGIFGKGGKTSVSIAEMIAKEVMVHQELIIHLVDMLVHTLMFIWGVVIWSTIRSCKRKWGKIRCEINMERGDHRVLP